MTPGRMCMTRGRVAGRAGALVLLGEEGMWIYTLQYGGCFWRWCMLGRCRLLLGSILREYFILFALRYCAGHARCGEAVSTGSGFDPGSRSWRVHMECTKAGRFM